MSNVTASDKGMRYQVWDIFGRGWQDVTKDDYERCKNDREKAVRVVSCKEVESEDDGA